MIADVSMAVASLTLRHLARHYGSVRAVDDLSLEVPDGAFVTLLGPSGCGKSTTLNLVAGLDRPDAGTVLLGERDVTRLPPNERRMAMVFQSYALYPNMTVFENIGFSLKLRRRPASEIHNRVTAVAEMLDIAHLLERKPAQLSGGQQQRVALGRALVKKPLVFLLDEPFSNLDAALRARMRTEVKHLHLALGTTSLFVTHDQEEAMTLSDLICVMREGKIVQSGSPREIYSKPRNLYVAGFVGKPKMSLLVGSLERGDDGVAFVNPDVRIELGSAAKLGLADGDWPRVALGVRAEDVTIHRGGSETGRAMFPSTVGLMEPIGSDTFVELLVGDATIVARVDPDADVAPSQSVSATLRPGGIHLFSRDSGERIVA
jgi:multiple sugar transport system ATP-binding protein